MTATSHDYTMPQRRDNTVGQHTHNMLYDMQQYHYLPNTVKTTLTDAWVPVDVALAVHV